MSEQLNSDPKVEVPTTETAPAPAPAKKRTRKKRVSEAETAKKSQSQDKSQKLYVNGDIEKFENIKGVTSLPGLNRQKGLSRGAKIAHDLMRRAREKQKRLKNGK